MEQSTEVLYEGFCVDHGENSTQGDLLLYFQLVR